MKIRVWICLGVIPLLLGVTGCSSFNHEWKKAATQPVKAHDIAGRWEGRWHSDANGHNDRLRAIITAVSTNHYDVKFHAAYQHWMTLFLTVHFGYTVRMEAQNESGGLKFLGSEDLGFLAGGIYTYEGRADGTNFFSTYKSKYDWGTFEMKRPGGAIGQ
jgi:hypothetical protein